MDLLAIAFARFRESWATQALPAKFEDSRYDKAFARRICTLVFTKCLGDVEEYRKALSDFIALSEEFVRLQIELDETGRYRYSSFEDVRINVYDNPDVMERRYLNGLLLSQAFWTNHAKMFQYFVENFCRQTKHSGNALEVPCGTGFYVSEFARLNPGWTSSGIDLSESAVAFSRGVARANGEVAVGISRQDVFEYPEASKFDRLICGELLEHLEEPQALLDKLARLLAREGRIFLTTAVWAASIDHIYLFKSVQEVREMLTQTFAIESELALSVRDGFTTAQEKTPINYACILSPKSE